jgi:phosphomethylpyrimidine synthase
MGEASPEMIAVARDEGLDVEEVREALADGTAVIPANPGHRGLRPTGIGASMRVKVNVNLGRSPTTSCLSEEVEKVRVALRHGADAVMDLSVGSIRRPPGSGRSRTSPWRPSSR